MHGIAVECGDEFEMEVTCSEGEQGVVDKGLDYREAVVDGYEPGQAYNISLPECL